MTLRSGKFLTERGARARVDNYDDLISLIDDVKKAKYFKWDRLVEIFLGTLSAKQVTVLLDRLGNLGLGEDSRMKLVNRLADLGNRKEARAIINEAFDSFAAMSWHPWYDGGPKLEAANGLIALDGHRGRRRIFDTLIEDYISESRHPSIFLQSLIELLPILFDSPPIERIWKEIEEHIGQLTEFRFTDIFPPTPGDESLGIPLESMLFYLITGELDNPVLEVRSEAHKAICILIIDGVSDHDRVLKNLISERLEADDKKQAATLSVLETVIEKRPEYVRLFSDAIVALCASPSMIVRRIAIKMAKLLDLEGKSIKPERQRLSPYYTLELPKAAMSDRALFYEVSPPDHIYPDTEDPLEMIRPFQPAFETLSELSQILIENLSVRAAQLMGTLSPESTWNKQAEEMLRNRLNSADFKVAHIRLRIEIAHRAFGNVVGELVDAQIIDNNDLNTLGEWLIINDPILSIIEPLRRLGDITPPEKKEMSDYPRKDWVTSGKENLYILLNNLSDGRFVLAELTKFVAQDRESPGESRFSIISHPDLVVPSEIDNESYFFGFDFRWFAHMYPHLPGISKVPLFIIHASARFCENWLAFNPRLGLGLGWQVKPSGLFKWVDDNSEIMVESLKWQDGCLLYSGPFGYGEVCGEGWLVVASEKAVEQMKKKLHPADRVRCVVRTMNKRDIGPVSHSAISRERLW